ncbi:MAG: alpha-galactosidase [Massiliimalia sp.]|jgi:alpha-galactosidase
MSIRYFEDINVFQLDTPSSTYAIQVLKYNVLGHLYYGHRLETADLRYLIPYQAVDMSPNVAEDKTRSFSLDVLPLECSCANTGDYRENSFAVRDAQGFSACDLRYRSHKIYQGKPSLNGLPATFAGEEDAQTLEILCVDELLGMEVSLLYTVFEKLDVITRSAVIKNASDKDFTVERALSCCIDFRRADMDFVTLDGTWARERGLSRTPLRCGKQSVDSVRGNSSAQHNPFAALCDHTATEDYGDVYGFNFVYSGNFVALAERTPMDYTRFVMGMNPFNLSFLLKPEETLTLPEVVMVYSDEGFGKMTRTFHDLYRNHLIRGKYAHQKRPILINNWEATYFNFDTDKLLAIAKQASELGIEMLVMDDGWFGKRDDDTSGLGDWFVNEKKLPGGLKRLVDGVNSYGLKFGMWFEPEMINEDTDVYRAHPDWCVHIPNRARSTGRFQMVMDITRPEVRDYIYDCMKKVLSSANVEYVKWDMNRCLTEVGGAFLPQERRGEFYHRYILGVYDLMNRLTTDFPNILLENCSSGGARFDPAMLYFSPQIWTSDDTDAIERLKIQYGTAFVYPVSTMGAHVSAIPNHQTGRMTPFATRSRVALAGTFGYELDPTKLSDEDKAEVRTFVADYHKYNDLIREGDYYRYTNPNENVRYDSYAFIAKDKSEALVTYVKIMTEPHKFAHVIKLKGLDPAKNYRDEATGIVYPGDVLIHAGYRIPALHGDYTSCMIHLIAE